jgi:hypothetical protein
MEREEQDWARCLLLIYTTRRRREHQTKTLADATILLMTSVTHGGGDELLPSRKCEDVSISYCWLICMDWSMEMVLGIPGSRPE